MQFVLSMLLPLAASVLILPSCVSVEVALDEHGLDGLATAMLADEALGNPRALATLVTARTSAVPAVASDATWSSAPLGRWEVTLADGRVIAPERLTFFSPVGRADQADEATFYLYRVAPLAGGRAILWVPGLGFSRLAVHFVRRLWQTELEHGWSVLIYVPPYHLERRTAGRDDGEGFVVASPESSTRLLLHCASELITARRWLTAQGVTTVGGWGGSLGAALLTVMAREAPLDHAAFMIPLLDWHRPFARPELARVRERLSRAGFATALLATADALMSPVDLPLPAPAARMLIQYARYDQLTPAAVTEAYARTHGVNVIKDYERSHATMLIGNRLYADYDAYLTTLDAPRRAATRRPHRRISWTAPSFTLDYGDCAAALCDGQGVAWSLSRGAVTPIP